jgi:hypothetical protein
MDRLMRNIDSLVHWRRRLVLAAWMLADTNFRGLLTEVAR